jgi:general secretion pathway protein K
LEDWREDKKNNEFVDDLEQVENALFLPVDDALLEAQFNDLHGRINLNDLVYVDGIPNPIMSERFKRLLDRLALDDVKLERIQDWIDENQDATGIEGVEDGEYLSLEPPYRTGGQVFSHPSELMLIEGVDRESYEALLPFVTTLPQGLAHINVNTASAEVLQSLVENLPDNVAEELASKAKESPWKSIQEFAAEPLLKGLKLDTTYLDVASNFYELATRITLSDRKVRLRSILYRAKEDGSVTLLQRDQGQKYLITKSGV